MLRYSMEELIYIYDLHLSSIEYPVKWLVHILSQEGTMTKLFWIILRHHQVETGSNEKNLSLDTKKWKTLMHPRYYIPP